MTESTRKLLKTTALIWTKNVKMYYIIRKKIHHSQNRRLVCTCLVCDAIWCMCVCSLLENQTLHTCICTLCRHTHKTTYNVIMYACTYW